MIYVGTYTSLGQKRVHTRKTNKRLLHTHIFSCYRLNRYRPTKRTSPDTARTKNKKKKKIDRQKILVR